MNRFRLAFPEFASVISSAFPLQAQRQWASNFSIEFLVVEYDGAFDNS